MRIQTHAHPGAFFRFDTKCDGCYDNPMFIRFLRLLAAVIIAIPALFQPAALAFQVDDGKSLTLTFTGDCTLGGDERHMERETSFFSYIGKNGYTYPFARVRHLFERDDLTVINLENVLYDGQAKRAKKNYVFRAPTDYVEILKQSSVELAFLGNNHMLDYGKPGMTSTIDTLSAGGIGWFGSNNALSGTHVFEKDGIKVGFIGSYTAYWFSQQDKFERELAALKDAGCQVIIGIIHDGTEYSFTHNKNQRLMANWLVRNGVHLVVGHHPHVPQGVDVVDGVTVIYSLGNFSFGGNHLLDISRRPGKRADRALLARVELRFDSGNRYTGHQVNLIPVSPSGETEFNNYQPVLLSGAEALDTLAIVQADTPFPLAPYIEGIGALQDFVPHVRPPESTPEGQASPEPGG